MKAPLTLAALLLGSLVLGSCCCQSQSMPALRPMPRNLAQDNLQPAYVAPVKVFTEKGK